MNNNVLHHKNLFETQMNDIAAKRNTRLISKVDLNIIKRYLINVNENISNNLKRHFIVSNGYLLTTFSSDATPSVCVRNKISDVCFILIIYTGHILLPLVECPRPNRLSCRSRFVWIRTKQDRTLVMHVKRIVIG